MENTTTTSVPSDAATYMFHWSLIVIGSATLTMNAMFSWMFIEFRKVLLVHNNNKILFSMTVADGLVGISCILLGGLLMLHQSQTTYKLFGILPLFGTMFTSILSLGILTIDRLVAVKLPLRYKSIMYPGKVHVLILISWVIPVLITLQESVVYIYASWVYELKLRGIMLAVIFSTGSTLLLIANTKLSFAIRRHTRFLNNHSNFGWNRERAMGPIANETSSEMRNEGNCMQLVTSCKKKSTFARSFHKEIKAAKTCIIITFLFVFCWAPLTAYRFSYSLGNRIGVVWLRRMCLLLASLNSFLNPLVYLMNRRGFRAYMWKITIMNAIRKKLNISEFHGS